MKPTQTLKDFIVTKMSQTFYDDDGTSVPERDVYRFFDDYLDDVSKNELIEWSEEYVTTLTKK